MCSLRHVNIQRTRTTKLLFGTPSRAQMDVGEGGQEGETYVLCKSSIFACVHSAAPSSSLAPTDATILKVSESHFRLPFELFSLLGDKPGTYASCPLDEDASDNIKIDLRTGQAV